MSANQGWKNFKKEVFVSKLAENVLSAKQKVKNLFYFREKQIEEIIEEFYDVKNLNIDSLNSEIEKLRKRLQKETSDTYSCNEAAFLLYSYISRLMVEKKSNYESLSTESDKKEGQKAAGNLTSISYLLDISSEIRKEYDLESCSLGHQLSAIEGKRRSRPQDIQKETECTSKELAERRLREIKEKNQMLRRYVEQQSSV